MAEQITITAGPVSKTALVDLGSTGSTLITGWEWPAPEPKRRTVRGRDGSRPLGPGDYEDRTITLTIERVGTGSSTSSQTWLQAWAAVDGAVSQVEDAILAITTASSGVLTFDVISCKVDPTNRNSIEWHRGSAQAKVTVTARPFGYGAQATLAGTLTTTNGLPVWTASTPVAGDVEALADITATWSDTRREAMAATCTSDPITWGTVQPGQSVASLPLAVLPTWSSGTVSGSLRSTVMTGPVPTAQAAAVVKWAVTVPGSYRADLRMRVEGTEVKTMTIALVQNGRVLGEGSFVPRKIARTAGVWGTVQFGTITVREVGDVFVVLSGTNDYAATAYLDLLTLTPSDGRAARLAFDDWELVPQMGDDPPPVATVALNGRSGTLGGTWTASGFNVTLDGIANTALSSGALATAQLGGALVLGSALSARFMTPAVTAAEVSFRLSSVAKTLSVYFADSGVSVGVGGIFPQQDDKVGVWRDVRLIVDEAGRWEVRLGDAGRPLRLVGQGHDPAFVGQSLTPEVVVNARAALAGGELLVSSFRTYATRRLQDVGGRQFRWAPDAVLPVSEGPYPTLQAGTVPRVVMRAGPSDGDSPAAPSPTALTVKATPRYLQVPA